MVSCAAKRINEPKDGLFPLDKIFVYTFMSRHARKNDQENNRLVVFVR